MTQRKPTPTYTPEFRARGVRLFNENRANYASDNAAYRAIASKLGCSPDSLRVWCQQSALKSPERVMSDALKAKTPIEGLFLSGQDVVCQGIQLMCGFSLSPGRAYPDGSVTGRGHLLMPIFYHTGFTQ